jgi:DsbE subfamily thiol:disulfide oxidoreductase
MQHADVQRPIGVKGLLAQTPYAPLLLGIALLVGAVWLMEGGLTDESATNKDTTAVTVSGVQGGVTPRLDEPAPTFTLEATDGARVALADLRGRPVFVNFWASWCPPCRGEMPDIQRLADEDRDAGLVVLGVNLEEEREQVLRYGQTLGLSFPLLVDRTGAVASRYNVTGLPTSYFVDRDGVIRDRNVGPLTPRGLRSKVASILE